MSVKTPPPLIYSQIQYLLSKSPLPFKIEQLRSGSKTGKHPDRFTLQIPFCLDCIKWDVIYNAQYPLVAPDFVFSPEDEEFHPLLVEDQGDKRFEITSLCNWNIKDPSRLLLVVHELRKMYLEYQKKRVAELDDDRLKFEISTLLSRKPQEVKFAIPLLENIPLNKIVQCSPWKQEQKIYLQAIFPITLKYSIPKAPRLTLVSTSELKIVFPIDDVILSTWVEGMCMAEYLPNLEHSLEAQILEAGASIGARRRFIEALAPVFGRPIEADSVYCRRATVLVAGTYSFLVHFALLVKNKPRGSGLRSYPILGNLPDFIKNENRFLQWITEILSTTAPTHTVVLRVPSQPDQIITSNPLNVEYVLKTNFQNYPKGDLLRFILRDLLGDGIFNSDEEQWHSQRKTASFEFSKRSLQNFVMEIVQVEILQRLIPLLDVAVEKRTVLNLQDVLHRFAFDNICKEAFDFDPATLSEDGIGQNIPENFMAAFNESTDLIMRRFLEPAVFIWRAKRFLNIGRERRLKESMKVVNDFAFDIIQSRKSKQVASSSQSKDLLTHFATKEDSTEQSLRDVIVNFVAAGRETTSSALTWFFWLLSSNPNVEHKILEEIKFIKAKKQNHADGSCTIFDFDQLRGMNYLHAAISESLRLYPPVYIDTQTAANNDVMPDGTLVKKGTLVSYCAYSMGRTKSIWGSDCCEFKPERWLVDGVFQPKSTFKFPVFHAGPRMCLGKEMAYIQMKSIVVCMLDKFEYMVTKGSPPEFVLSVTLRMKGGLPVQFKKRGREE